MEFTCYNDDYSQDMITIEYLRQFYSCSTCGVDWQDDHITLDCDECGDYAMSRPCLTCDGKCESIWTRNLALTHEKQRAFWEGECKLIKNNSLNNMCIVSSKPLKHIPQTQNLNKTSSYLQSSLKVS